MPRLSILLLIVIVASPAGGALADPILGRWCDRMLPAMPEHNREITIEIRALSDAVAISRFADGGHLEQRLVEKSRNLYWVEESPHGDGYRFVPSTGELQLIDKYGLISTAKRLGDKPTPGDCLR